MNHSLIGGGRQVWDGVVHGQISICRRERFDSPPKVPDGIVLSVTGFRLPGADLFPQVHHLAAYLPSSILMLPTIQGRETPGAISYFSGEEMLKFESFSPKMT